MDRLHVMRRLTAQGVAPAEAAAWARRVPVPIDMNTSGPGPPTGTSPEPDWIARIGESSYRDGGGTAIPVGRAGPAARGLARAAMRLDAPALRDIIELTIADRGVIRAWDEVIMPVLIGIGERYEATQKFIEVEHVLSRSVTEGLSSVPRPSSNDLPRVLLTTADEEQHTLPLEALAAALAEKAISSRLLGARVPPHVLTDAIGRTGPVAVVVWSQTPETADPEQLAGLLSGPHRPMLVAAAGPGWADQALPGEVPLLGSLTHAVGVIGAAAAA
jgi:hypothetical protein